MVGNPMAKPAVGDGGIPPMPSAGFGTVTAPVFAAVRLFAIVIGPVAALGR
jgi:hypothetical protein